jgi:uncharacterized protein YacL (UPF0231 family)
MNPTTWKEITNEKTLNVKRRRFLLKYIVCDWLQSEFKVDSRNVSEISNNVQVQKISSVNMWRRGNKRAS